MLITINIEFRSTVTGGVAVKHSANPKLDNCYRDYATTKATELSELLRASGLDVPEGISRPADQ